MSKKEHNRRGKNDKRRSRNERAAFDTELVLAIAKAIALEARAKYNTYSAQGCHLYDNTPPKKSHFGCFVTEGVIAAQNSDLAILCVGLDASLEGEQGDRGNQFPSGDRRDLQRVVTRTFG